MNPSHPQTTTLPQLAASTSAIMIPPFSFLFSSQSEKRIHLILNTTTPLFLTTHLPRQVTPNLTSLAILAIAFAFVPWN